MPFVSTVIILFEPLVSTLPTALNLPNTESFSQQSFVDDMVCESINDYVADDDYVDRGFHQVLLENTPAHSTRRNSHTRMYTLINAPCAALAPSWLQPCFLSNSIANRRSRGT